MKSQESMQYNSKSKYNIFHILEVTEKEVVMCRFLTDLLNPEGQHGCGILFLKSFFNDVLNENRINDTLLAHTDVIKEFAKDAAELLKMLYSWKEQAGKLSAEEISKEDLRPVAVQLPEV